MIKTSPRHLTPFLTGSILFHLLGSITLFAYPRLWVSVVSALMANQAIIVGAGLHPRNSLLGPNQSRLNSEREQERSVALTFDDGPDPVITPWVLEILGKYNCKATFFVIGKKAQYYADTLRSIAAAGHELGNHSWTHSPAFFFHSPSRIATEIDRTQAVMEDTTGTSPVLFRAPAGIRSPLLGQVLADRGLKLISWSRRAYDTVDYRSEKILHRLTTGLTSGEILLLHDGVSSSTGKHPVIYNVLPTLLETFKSLGIKPGPVSPNIR